jgi:uncharacterized membrane protein
MMKKFYFTLAVMALLGIGKDAHAWLQLCNRSSTYVWASYVYYSNSSSPCGYPDWVSRGWWRLAPNQCAIVQGGTLQTNQLGSNYLVRAEGDDGRRWQGPYTFRVKNSAFQVCNSIGDTQQYDAAFGIFNIGSASNYTLSFGN